jgi:glycosyltransferase involved in cell wall biosynthesis
MTTPTLTLDQQPVDQNTRPASRMGEGTDTVRVMHVITGDFYAGAERVQDLLAQQLGQWGFEVGFACLKPGQFAKMRHARQAPIYDVPMHGRFDPRPVWKLVRIIRRENYKLLHSHTVRSALVASMASRITGVPLVSHLHSPTSEDTTRRLRNRLNAFVERISFRRASALITVSNSLARYVQEQGFPEAKLSVVPNGVPSRTPVGPRDIADKSWTLGTVALFRPRKGIEVLLEALSILRTKGFPVKLRAVGDFYTDEYRAEVLDLCKELNLGDSVQWTGFTQDVDAELSQMDIFALPSLFGEGMPMVVLEAMATGLPVVASDVEGIPEAVRDGLDGLICEPADPHELASAIARIISGEVNYRELSQNAFRRHARKFSDASMAAGVAEVYRRVL